MLYYSINMNTQTITTPKTTTLTIRTFRDVLGLNWRQFEYFSQWLLEKEGCRDVTVTRKHGTEQTDRGIDITCRRQGLRCLVQCKHWNTDWSEPGEHLPLTRALRELGGCLRRDNVGHGIFVTTARYNYAQICEARDMDIWIVGQTEIERILDRAGPCQLHC